MKKILTIALTTLLSMAALAHDYNVDQLEVGHPWSRPTPPNAQVGGGFMSITNNGTTPDRLISVEADFAQKVEIHETRQDGEMMRMMHLPEGLELRAGETVDLQPGGYHIMFMGLNEQLREGDRLEAELEFEKAGKLSVVFHVEARSGGQSHEHDHH